MDKLIILFLIPGILTSANFKKGESIFKQKCSACHTIGKGKRVGPDLKDVHKKADIEWLKKFIKKPSDLFGKDKRADSLLKEFAGIKMPDLGLSDKEVKDILFYIQENSKTIEAKKAEKKEEKKKIKVSEETFNKEKYKRGKALFSGEIAFKNKGTPCISCHNVQKVFPFGGGRLGPDLSKAIKNYGEEGLSLTLSNIPFPTMEPIFKSKPLKKDEINAIVYFMKNLKKEKSEKNFFYLVLPGFVVFFLIPAFIWRKRNYGIRRNLLKGGK